MTHCLFPVVRAGQGRKQRCGRGSGWSATSFLSWEPQDTIRSSPGLVQA